MRARIGVRLLWLSVVLGAPVSAATSSADTEVLVSYEGGAITRSQLRALVAKRGASETEVLEEEAVGRIAMLAAQQDGLDRSDAFLARVGAFEEQLRLQAYAESLVAPALAPDARVALVQAQVLLLRPDLTAAAREELLRRLNSPENSTAAIEQIVRAHTRIQWHRVNGGYLAPDCATCLSGAYAALIRSLRFAPIGRFLHHENERGHWLARRVAVDEVAASDMEAYYARFFRDHAERLRGKVDAQALESAGMPTTPAAIAQLSTAHAQKITQRVQQDRYLQRIHALIEQGELVWHPLGDPTRYLPSNDARYTDDTPLCTVHGKLYTYGELNRRLPRELFGVAEQLIHLNFIALDRALRTDTVYRAVERTMLYRELRRERLQSELRALYFDTHVPRDPPIPEGRIRAEYDARRATEYPDKPYEAVRAELRSYLQAVSEHHAYLNVQAALAKRFQLQIHRDRVREQVSGALPALRERDND